MRVNRPGTGIELVIVVGPYRAGEVFEQSALDRSTVGGGRSRAACATGRIRLAEVG